MMLAMMLPGAAPVTLLVASIARKRAAGSGALPVITALFVLGYVSVWFGFSVGATALQWWVQRLGLLSEAMATNNAIVVGGVLVTAGLYQWTPLKDTCLRHCRSPLDFLLYHWRDGALGALSSGFRHGLFCLGCCWMLMALLFVVGIMNLLWIAAIAMLVLLEKTAPWGRRVNQVTGSVLVLWGGTILALAI